MTFQSLIIVRRNQDGAIKDVDMVRPSNFHAHLRAGDMMKTVAKDIMWWVKYLLVMPNTGPIDTVKKVKSYYAEICALRDSLGLKTEFIMTVYLTNKLTPVMVHTLADLPFKVEVKYYPPHKGATTGSGLGVPLDMVSNDTWKVMAERGMPLIGHFESVEDKNGNVLPMEEREDYFMTHEFRPFRDNHPNLHINIEHASTALAIARVKEDLTEKTTCGITPHHMILTLGDLKMRSWANHGRCMPIPKGPEDMIACRKFATSGDARACLGDDTAPHPASAKENIPFDEAACGCWLPHSLALYAYAFELEDALDQRFVNFTAYNGANWRGLDFPNIDDRVVLVGDTVNDIPDPLHLPDGDRVVPLGWTTEPDRLKIGLAAVVEQQLKT